MTEQEWLRCADPLPMLAFLRGKYSDRKLRLFAVACCRRIWHLLTDERSRQAVETAERFADGWATASELETSADAASAVSDEDRERFPIRGDAFPHVPSLAAYNVAIPIRWWGAAPAFVAPDEIARGAVPDRSAEAAAQCDVVRDIFGPLPLRSVVIDPPWMTPTVKALAHAIYRERAFDRLPIMADALEDAGCTNADILTHCRGPGSHVRGCWMVDLLYNDLDKAGDLWQAGQSVGAGRLILEHLPAEARPKWAARILRLVLERSGVVAGPPYLSPAAAKERSHFQRILEIAENGQWALGHRCFNNLRDSTLAFDEMQRVRKLTQDEEMVHHLLVLAELVAKVTYNAADPTDPFDDDSGWYIASALRRLVDRCKDEEFSKEAWSALCCEEK